MQPRLVSAMEKVFLDEQPRRDDTALYTGFQNERICFQVAWYAEDDTPVRAEVDSPLPFQVRQVLSVPVKLPVYPTAAGYGPVDEDYLRKDPGLFPDLLRNMPGDLLITPHAWHSLWVDVNPNAACAPGDYTVTIRLTGKGSVTAHVRLLPGKLPPQRLKHTRWFHADCLAQYYGVEAFSEEHWAIIGNFLRAAAKNGVNMTLMPVHTPPLDTAVGGERLTVQLVDVYRNGDQYTFRMDKVRRWIHLCLDCGLDYFEIAHLYTQWGCAAAPKIMATVDGTYRRLFGWDTPALSAEYRAFLAQYIPALRQVFEEEGIASRVMWHISDEPNAKHLKTYLAAKKQVLPLLQGCTIRDALSSFDYYRQGIVEAPIVAVDHIDPFLQANVPDLWAYYCCAQVNLVSNQFIAMPSYRNRVLAAMLFKYGVTGFLQWGYNFYNTQLSTAPLNPYESADACGAFPAGDPFQVYPGPDGQPEESLRTVITALAMQDLRAMEWLADMTSREQVVRLVEETAGESITFSQYPRHAAWLLALRERINQEILRHAAQ